MAGETELTVAELEHRIEAGFSLLQVIVGIRLRSVTDPESRRHLTWLSDVTAALGLLNRRLRQDETMAFDAYLDEAAGFWRRACEGRGVQIEVNAASDVPDSHALALAIMSHELIGNAVRHAFPDDRQGVVNVILTRTADGLNFLVRDSGVGGAALELGEGLSLVLGLSHHLGGSMSIEAAPGAGVGIRIRLPLAARSTH